MSRPLLSLFVLLTACSPGPGPTASAGAEVVGEPGQTFLLDGSASVAQGARYVWSVLDGTATATLIDPHQPVAFLVPESEGVYTLGLEVCDALGRCEAATTRAIVGAKARQAAFGGPSFGVGPSLGGLGKNRAPLAEASASRSLASASIIRLDGSGSTDPDGDALRYRWSFTTRPADSALTDADIQDSTSALASFKADTSGTYAVRLVVRDGLASDSALLSGIVVKIVEDSDPVDATAAPRWGDVEGADARQSAFGGPSFGGGPALGGFGKNRAPLAEASASRSLASASIIRLDGSGSTDPDGDALRYRWSFTTRPADSALTDADIQDSTSALASFKADTSGTYAVRLVVRDGLASDSALLTGIVVKIVQDDDPVDDATAAPRWGDVEGADARQAALGGASLGVGPSLGGLGKNRAPLAEASASRSLASASIIRLDGSGSTDPDGDTLRYRWSFTTRPADSALTDADIQDSTSALASFKADTSGTYGVRLVVRDGLASSSDLVPGIVVKVVEDHDPVDENTAAPRWGDVEGADGR
jgi:sirohydrochlorin ferrochelatase